MRDIEQAARQVQQAIRDEGRAPAYHREIMAKHRMEWPTLWRALDRLMLAIEDEEAS